MKLTRSLSQHAHDLIWKSKFIIKRSRMNYTLAERASLLRALRPRDHETNVLNFRVSCLGEEPFQHQLREIFFQGQYLFDAGVDRPVILDCGANIGLATLFFKRLYPEARISSFEADPATASVLQKNIAQNHLGLVSVHNLMLANADGERPFYVASEVGGSLKMSSLPDRVSNNRRITVKCGRLSKYIEGPVDLLKLDVEGAEFEVLTDLKSSGKISQIERMVIEYHHKVGSQASCLAKFLALLEEEGFDYQISGRCDPIAQRNVFQDILIGAYRPSNSEGAGQTSRRIDTASRRSDAGILIPSGAKLS